MPLESSRVKALREVLKDLLEARKTPLEIAKIVAKAAENSEKSKVAKYVELVNGKARNVPSADNASKTVPVSSDLKAKTSAERKQCVLDVISEFDAKIALPVILEITQEITKQVNTTNAQGTLAFLNDTLKKLNDADVKQNMSALKLGWQMRNIKTKDICKDLDDLVIGAEKIEITDDVLSLWQELAIWLEGLYRHSYYLAYKDPKSGVVNESFHNHDFEDTLFMGWTKSPEDGFPNGITKLDVSRRYHMAAQKIEAKIIEFIEKKNVKVSNVKPTVEVSNTPAKDKQRETDVMLSGPNATSSSSPSNATVVQEGVQSWDEKGGRALNVNIIDQADFSKQLAQLREAVTKLGIPGHFSIVFHVPKSDACLTQADKIRDIFSEIVDPVKDLTASGNPLPSESASADVMQTTVEAQASVAQETLTEEAIHKALEPFKDSGDLVRFQILVHAIDGAILPDRLNEMFSNYKDSVVASLKAYKSSWIRTGGLPLSIFGRAHSALADEKIAEIESAADVVEQLKILFNLWNELRSKASTDLLNKVTELLNSAYEILSLGSVSKPMIAKSQGVANM